MNEVQVKEEATMTEPRRGVSTIIPIIREGRIGEDVVSVFTATALTKVTGTTFRIDGMAGVEERANVVARCQMTITLTE